MHNEDAAAAMPVVARARDREQLPIVGCLSVPSMESSAPRAREKKS